MSDLAHAALDSDSEVVADAMEDGDVAFTRGTAAAAFRHRDFRIFWAGLFASNIGTWMQNIIVAAYVQKLTGDARWVGVVAFAQLGPLVLLSNFSGMLADSVDRKRFLTVMQLAQLAGSVVLAGIALEHHPSPWSIFVCMLTIGIANALGGPTQSAIAPSLVPKEDLPGAVSLFSFQMNMSRVIGPIIGGVLYAVSGAALVFAVNALTYLFAVYGIVVARYPRRVNAQFDGGAWRRFTSGFRLAWADPLVRRIMFILWTMSFVSLNFISFMAPHAQRDLGIDPASYGYELLYALFGIGAAAGAMSVGSVFARRDKGTLVRPALVVFAVALGVFGALRVASPAYVVVVVLGYAYFVVVTALSTQLQEHIGDEIRGRIMAIWIMGFGGLVGLSALVLGPIAQWSVSTLLIAGAVWLAVLATVAGPSRLRAEVEPGVRRVGAAQGRGPGHRVPRRARARARAGRVGG
jgi:MFS family permease